MKTVFLIVASSLLSHSAFAEKAACTVFLSGGQSAKWVESQVVDSLSDFGCTVVADAAQAKYSITWGYEQANCRSKMGPPNPVLARMGELVAGTRGVSVILSSADGALAETVSKSIYAPALHGNTCNIMNGWVNRGTAKLLEKFVQKIANVEAENN